MEEAQTRDSREPRLGIPAYECVMHAFMSSVMEGMIGAEPLLGKIGVRMTGHAGPTRNVPGPQPVDHPLTTFEESLLVHTDVIRNTDIEAFIILTELAAKYEEAMGRTLVRTVSDVTLAVGNVVDAQDRPFSWDHFLDALEKIEISFDEDGRHHVDIGINPETYKLLQRIKITPAQQQRYDEIIARKKEQWDAQKRTRRLPRAGQRAGF